MAAPAPSDVRAGVVYDDVSIPAPGDVRAGVVYSAAGSLPALILEDGFYILLEDGSKLLLE